MGKKLQNEKADKRIREAQRAVLATAVEMVHFHDRAFRQSALGLADDHREQWRLWDELQHRVHELDGAKAEKEAQS